MFSFNFKMPDCFFINTPKKQNKPTVQQTRKFYNKKNQIIPTILSVTQQHEVIHGERAVQKYVPKHLHRHTLDLDILTPTPRKDARETERALDKKFGGDIFFIEKGIHEGTFRVKSHTNNQAYADYTKPEKGMPPFNRIGGFNYVTKKYITEHNRSILNDPEASYRHAKDKDTLNRFKIKKR